MSRLGDRPFLRLGAISFVYVAITALLIQLLLLPYVMPRLHAGHGLLVGGDWLVFHQVAVDLVDKMRYQGWQVWQLSPGGHAPAGIAAIFYYIFTPEPWVLIPLNAALHALATVLLARIVWMVTGNVRISILSALPFLFFPSASAWYAQIHKDGFFIAGIFACFYGWLGLTQVQSWCTSRGIFASLAWIVGGTILIGMVRDYGVQLIVFLSLPFAFIAVARLLRTGSRAWPMWHRILAVMLVLSIPVATSQISMNRYKTAAETLAQSGGGTQDIPGAVIVKPLTETWRWADSMPRKIDEYFFALSAMRVAYSVGYPGAKSMVDREVRFDSAVDFPAYLPRAMQIGFLAPFPRDWSGRGSIEAGSFMRRISAFEMLGMYAALLFLPYSLWRWRKCTEAWLIIGSCTIAITLYTYIIPNVGTLYRMRYGFIMIIMAMGVAGALSLFDETRRRNQERQLH